MKMASKRNSYYGELAHQINKAMHETQNYGFGHLMQAYWLLNIWLEKVKIRPEHAFLLGKKSIFAKLYAPIENVTDKQVKKVLENAEQDPNYVKEFLTYLS